MKTISALLIDNVQFIYESALANLELESFGVKFNITNSLREFLLEEIKNEEELIKRLAYFKKINKKNTDYSNIIKHNKTRSVNQYLTHWIYPYKGKFHPQMIRALLNIISLKPGKSTVLDPFIGSGTTALEAQLLGINCIGIDISPLCILQSKVKTESIFVLDQIKSLKEDAIKSFTSNNIRSFYDVNKGYDYNEFLKSINDDKVKNFFLLAKLVALSDKARRKRNITESFINNLNLMIDSVEDYKKVTNELKLKLGKVSIEKGDSRDLRVKKVDGIITSPPYSIALDYVTNDAHSLKALGEDVKNIREEFIGVRGKGNKKINLYNEDIKISFDQMFNVLKPRGYCVIVLGNATYNGKEVKTVEFTINHCKKIGFELVRNIEKIIYGLYNVMQKENILIFQKKG